MRDKRQEMWDRRRETGYRRKDTEERRRKTGEVRQETGDWRQETGDERQETGDDRWETGDWRGFSDIISEKVSAYNLAGELYIFKERKLLIENINIYINFNFFSSFPLNEKCCGLVPNNTGVMMPVYLTGQKEPEIWRRAQGPASLVRGRGREATSWPSYAVQ